MDLLLSLHDQTVLDELSDEYSGVGLTDLFDFARVDPDSFMSALKDLGGNTLLALQTDHKFR